MRKTLAGEAFIGQEDAMKILESWRAHPGTQALLFSGPEGIGKRKLAGQVAASLLCHDIDEASGEACGTCKACLMFNAGTHPDFHRLAREGKERNIPIDRIRKEVIADIGMKPQFGRYKVYLLEADDLAEPAQNALLKTLEEPFPYAYLLLTVSRPTKLLATTLSRLLEIRLTVYDDSVMRRILALNDVADESLIKAVLSSAAGNPGQALTLANSEWFGELREELFGLFGQMAVKNLAGTLTADVKTLMDMREHIATVFNLAESWLRDLLLLVREVNTSNLIHQDQIRELTALARRLNQKAAAQDEHAIMAESSRAVYRMLDAVATSRRALEQNANLDMTLTRLLMIIHRQFN